jgi:outer membrane protein TolC
MNARNLTQEAILVAVVVVGVVLFAGTARGAEPGQCPVQVVDARSVTNAALAVYDDGLGDADAARVRGAGEARQSVPSRVRSLEVGAQPEFSLSDDVPNEYSADVGLMVDLGRLPSLRRAALAAREEASSTQGAVRRWQFVVQVQDAYADWVAAEIERTHLEEYGVEAAEDLQGLRDAMRDGLASRIDVADMEAEVARIRAELAESGRRAAFARADLKRLFGTDCPLKFREQAFESTRDNPWVDLLGSVAQFPEIRAIEARATQARRDAEVANASEPWSVGLGVGGRMVGLSDPFVLGYLQLSIPLAKSSRPDAILARSEATALDRESAWTAARIRSGLEAERQRFDAIAATIETYQDEYLQPLEARVELLREARGAGQVPVERLVRARRELHEAHHRTLTLRAELHSRALRARAVRELLQATTVEGKE